MSGGNGALVSDTSISDYNDKENGAVLEQTMPVHAIISLPNPTSFPILCFNLKKKNMIKNMEKFNSLELLFLWCLKLPGLDIWPRALLVAVEDCATLIFFSLRLSNTRDILKLILYKPWERGGQP